MIRTELREHIFKLLFQEEFNQEEDMQEHLKYYFMTLEPANMTQAIVPDSSFNEKYICPDVWYFRFDTSPFT